jgi:hypothetical protein
MLAAVRREHAPHEIGRTWGCRGRFRSRRRHGPDRIEERDMLQHVIVSFGDDKEFEYKVTAADLAGLKAEDARKWLDREFEDLECDVPNPIGKVLLVDRILSVAKYAGERRFREHRDWAEQFARNAAAVMGREVVRVDVANYTVGY